MPSLVRQVRRTQGEAVEHAPGMRCFVNLAVCVASVWTFKLHSASALPYLNSAHCMCAGQGRVVGSFLQH